MSCGILPVSVRGLSNDGGRVMFRGTENDIDPGAMKLSANPLQSVSRPLPQ